MAHVFARGDCEREQFPVVSAIGEGVQSPQVVHHYLVKK